MNPSGIFRHSLAMQTTALASDNVTPDWRVK
jgi:hypothetical protein